MVTPLEAPKSTAAVRKRSWLERAHVPHVIYINQQVMYWTFHITGPIWRRSLKSELEESDFLPGTKYVLACNHQSRIDPFIIGAQVPYRIWKHWRTLSFFVANVFMDKFILGGFMLRMGSFPAKLHTRHPFGLEYARKMLARGNTVLIFPEGRRTIRGETPTRHGVEVLAHEPNVMIIPAHIEWRVGSPWRTYKLGIGKPFDASEMTAQEIMDRVYDQPVE